MHPAGLALQTNGGSWRGNCYFKEVKILNNVEDAKSKHDEELRQEFGEMVRACEKCAREVSRPWKVSTVLLSVALAAVLLWRKR